MDSLDEYQTEKGVLKLVSKLAQALTDSNNSGVSTPPHFYGKDDVKGKGWLNTFESDGPGTDGFNTAINSKIYNKLIILCEKGYALTYVQNAAEFEVDENENKREDRQFFPLLGLFSVLQQLFVLFLVFVHTKNQFKPTFCFLTKINCQSHEKRLSFVYAFNIVFVHSGCCLSMVLRLGTCHYPLNDNIRLIISIDIFLILQRTNILLRDVCCLFFLHITNRLNNFCSNRNMLYAI
jgi:hypothetical protein